VTAAATGSAPQTQPQPSAQPPTAQQPRLASGTPRVIGLLMVALVVASLAWGGLGAWTASQHTSAATDVLNTSEPVSLQARQMYQALSDADVTATTAFLASQQPGAAPSLTARRRYERDIAQAGSALSALEKAAAQAGNSRLAASLSFVATGLPVYTGYVAQAQSVGALGYQLLGGSFMQVASEEMNVTLLPAAHDSYLLANASLTARNAQATGLPWVVVTLVVSLALGFVLYRAQRWLSRRTRRTFNYGLLAASVALAVLAVWLLAAFAVARAHLQSAEAHGSVPAESLAQATITVQRARSDEVLNLISRSGSVSFSGDFDLARRQVGPGPGSALAAAAAGAQGSRAASEVATAAADARAWYTVGDEIFKLDVKSSYAQETKLVISTGTGSAAAGFDRLEGDLTRAIATDQAVFSSAATAGANDYAGVAVGFLAAAVLMAAGCTWGLSQRLAEYR
jgi:hypothetical protein